MPGQVYTGGTFDLLHPGHIRFLQHASLYGRLYVSVNTDEFVFRYKGSYPTMDLEERIEVLEGVRGVWKVGINIGNEDSSVAIDVWMDDIVHQETSPGGNLTLAIGSDWLDRDYLAQLNITEHFLRMHKIGLLFLPCTPHISSTLVRKRVADRNNH